MVYSFIDLFWDPEKKMWRICSSHGENGEIERNRGAAIMDAT